MTSGFDEWVVARTPSLLRFAHLLAVSDDQTGNLTDDRVDAAVEVPVRAALSRVWSRWESIVDCDDPDLRARRSVVDACASRRPARVAARVPVPAGSPGRERAADSLASWLAALPLRRRAAVVLCYAEGRADAEIAEVLGVTPAAVRKDLERALAALPPGLPAPPDITLREGLAGLADAAPTQLPGPWAPVDAPPRRRLRSPSAAAAAVLALVGTVAFVSHETRTPPGVIHYPSVSVPTSWRAESYAGVQVRVPGTWGWGGAPMHLDAFGEHGLGACGADRAAVLSPSDHASYVSSMTPFTGRPVEMTQRCVAWGSDGVMPGGDALWFASPMAVGLRPLGAVVAETRAVGDQHVTVFAADPALRREILGTAQQVEDDAHGCPTQAVRRSVPGADGLVPSSLSVCVYSQDTGAAVLLWSDLKGGSAALAYARAFAAASGPGTGSGSGGSSCPTALQGEWVALGLRDAHGGAERWDVLDPACGRLVGRRTEVPLTPADVSPWAGGGTTAYVDAPRHAGALLTRYFRGSLPG